MTPPPFSRSAWKIPTYFLKYFPNVNVFLTKLKLKKHSIGKVFGVF